MASRKCSNCLSVKDVSEFYKSCQSWCKECHKMSVTTQAKKGYFRKRNEQRCSSPKQCRRCKTVKPSADFIQHAKSRSKNCRNCIDECNKARSVNSGRQSARKNATAAEKTASQMFRNCRKRSSVMNLDFTMTREHVNAIVVAFCESCYHNMEPGHPFRPSLDRVDNSKGYTNDNVKIVWLIENLARNRFTEEQLIEFCKRKLGIQQTSV